MTTKQRDQIIDLMWTAIKDQKEPGWRAPGAVTVFKAGARWGFGLALGGDDDEATIRRFASAWHKFDADAALAILAPGTAAPIE